jgi:hypothetical protein
MSYDRLIRDTEVKGNISFAMSGIHKLNDNSYLKSLEFRTEVCVKRRSQRIAWGIILELGWYEVEFCHLN